MTVQAMTETEKTENYTRFIEANGWRSNDDGTWQRHRTFGGRLSLEGAFHLEHILLSLDDASQVPDE